MTAIPKYSAQGGGTSGRRWIMGERVSRCVALVEAGENVELLAAAGDFAEAAQISLAALAKAEAIIASADPSDEARAIAARDVGAAIKVQLAALEKAGVSAREEGA